MVLVIGVMNYATKLESLCHLTLNGVHVFSRVRDV